MTTKIEQLGKDSDAIYAELREILLKKQQDYGPLNIALAPGGPLNGLRVRMFDKIQRLSHLVESNNDTPNYESLRDTLIDLANYAIIGILVQNGQWEGIPNATKNSSSERPTNSIPRRGFREESHELHQVVSPDSAMVRR